MEQLVLEEPPTYQPLVPFDGPVAKTSDEFDVEQLIIKEVKTSGFRFNSISDYYHKYR